MVFSNPLQEHRLAVSSSLLDEHVFHLANVPGEEHGNNCSKH